MLELHVWGRAFGLPSIDPECLAAIAYLRCAAAVPPSWRLVAGNDLSVTPSGLLPALNHDGVWTSGYRPIVRYLVSKSLCRDLDAGLSDAQHADCLAYGAYLTASAAPLLDLSLYASAANWVAATRPAYSALLPFPLTWTVPPLIRAAAVRRVEHLGLAELDADFDPQGALHLSTGRDALPETFRRHLPIGSRKTVREEMTPEQAAAIRLFALAEDCLSVLDAALDGERFLPGSPASSLDCLAFGYLALMRDAPVPRSFLRDCLAEKTPRLSRFVDDMKSTCGLGQDDLPWAAPVPTSALRRGACTLDTILRHIPVLGEHYAGEVRRRAEHGVTGADRRAWILAAGLVATGATLGYGAYLYRAAQPFGSRTQVWRALGGGTKLSEYGEIGAILSGAMGAYGASSRDVPRGALDTSSGGRVVEMDSDVD